MKKTGIFLFLLAVFLFSNPHGVFSFPADFPLTRALAPASPAKGDVSRPQPKNESDNEWVTMPAGAKPAYMGIHGGTMPVSLLVSGDGSSLFTFVGRTGNDFLDALRNVYLPLPSIGNSTRGAAAEAKTEFQTGLFAGNATASMPVIALSGDRLASQSWFRQLSPFGLSATPLSIEGEVVKPESLSPARNYPTYFLPDYFLPRRDRR